MGGQVSHEAHFLVISESSDKQANGFYKLTGERYNESPVWQKASNSDIWLLKFSCGEWWVTNTKHKASGEARGWLHSVAAGHASPASVPEWKFWGGSSWRVQAVQVSEENAIPQWLKLKVPGARIKKDNIGGLYRSTDEWYNDGPVWQNAIDSDLWLLRFPSGRWLITSTAHKVSGEASGWLRSVAGRHASPTDISKWKSWDGTSWAMQAVEISQEIAIPQCLRVSGATAASSSDPEKVNGLYRFTGNLHNDSPLWQNASNSDIWLLKLSCGKWWITDTVGKVSGEAHGWLHSVGVHHARPTSVAEWKVWNGTTWSVCAIKVARALR
mmetsp:Transcript_23130/g.37953  ORF Transcript_23130/g.37953 Transcript_23130/m.37953 type:complete len:327 (-) Transcript_23130:8-988(-)